MEPEGCGSCGGGMPQVMNLQQFMQMMNQQQQSWTDKLKEIIKQIEKLPKKPKDRLEALVHMHSCLMAIKGSIHGWEQWFKSVRPLQELTKEEAQQVYETVKEVALIFLRLDLLVTEKAEKVVAEKIKKHEERRKKASKKSKEKGKKNGDKYVA
jgi:hypothetical protein